MACFPRPRLLTKLAVSASIAALLAAMPGMPALAGGLRAAAIKSGASGLPGTSPRARALPTGSPATIASPILALAPQAGAPLAIPPLPQALASTEEPSARKPLHRAGAPETRGSLSQTLDILASLEARPEIQALSAPKAAAEPARVLAAARALFDKARSDASEGGVPTDLLSSIVPLEAFPSLLSSLKPGKAKNPEVAILKYAASSFASGLVTLRRNIEAVETLGLAPLDMPAQVRMLLADSLDHVRQAANGKLAPQVPPFAAEIAAAIERLFPRSLDNPRALADLKSDIDRLVSLLLALSHSSEKDPERFVSAAGQRLRSLDAEEATPRSGAFGLASLAFLAAAFLYAVATATLWPLPTEFHWGSLWSLSPPAGFLFEAPRWAVIDVGLALLSLMSKEKFNQYYNPLNLEAKPLGQLVPYLFLAAGIEEVIFRSILLGSLAFALTLVSVPALPAMALAVMTSSIVFARVHGYGPKIARLFGGMVFGYLGLVHGLLMATMVHFLSNLILVLFSKIHDSLKKHIAAPQAPVQD